MKAFMLGWEFPPFISGGLGTACYGLTKALDKMGIEVTFVLPKSDAAESAGLVKILSAQSGKTLGFKNVKFRAIRTMLQPYMTNDLCGRGGCPQTKKAADCVKSGHLGKMGGATHYNWQTLLREVQDYAEKIGQLAEIEDFDIIHAHDWMTYPAGITAAKLSGKPLVVQVHSTEFDRSGENINQVIYDIERNGMHSAEKVIAVSNYTKNIITARYGVPAEKVVVVHNGVESRDTSTVSSIEKNDKIVLFMGRITMQKGPEYFITAAKKVLEVISNVKFIMAGTGDMIYRMINMAASLGIGHKILFSGFLRGDEVAKAYQMADLYVMPSVSEPFGIAPLEALQHNIPVLISKQSGVSEVLTHALKVDFWDVNEMTNKIVAVLKHSALHKTLSQNGSSETRRIRWENSAEKNQSNLSFAGLCVTQRRKGYLMPTVCFYFQVHQPFRMRHYTIFDRGSDYFDDEKNIHVCKKVAEKCYLPTNRLMLELIRKYKGKFKISYSLTGTLLEQLESYSPEVLASFKELANTGCVEFLAETYNHSLSFLYSKNEFLEQIREHKKKIYQLFGQKPRVFRNTELIYNNELASFIENTGEFDAILAEGADHILGYRSPNFVYKPVNCKRVKLLLKNYRLSDDIAFRFSNRSWTEWPVNAEKFASWINAANGCGHVVNLFMDYETFGEHQWADTGIFDFLRHLPGEILRHPDNNFKTPSEVIDTYETLGVVDIPYTISWADIERDLSAWLGNPMQDNAAAEIYRMEGKIKRTKNERIISDWRKLQTSDHFYYMCTKYFSDGDVHKYFNPYDSPYDSYINFMNILDNLNFRCEEVLKEKQQRKHRRISQELCLSGK